MAADALHRPLRPSHGMDDGRDRQEAEGAVNRGAGHLERHDVAGGGDTRRAAHRKGVLCRREDEPTLRPHQHRLPQQHHEGEHQAAAGTPHVRVPRHGDDCHRAVVRRRARAAGTYAQRTDVYILYGDSLQHPAAAERLLACRLQHPEGSRVDGPHRQDSARRIGHHRTPRL